MLLHLLLCCCFCYIHRPFIRAATEVIALYYFSCSSCCCYRFEHRQHAYKFVSVCLSLYKCVCECVYHSPPFSPLLLSPSLLRSPSPLLPLPQYPAKPLSNKYWKGSLLTDTTTNLLISCLLLHVDKERRKERRKGVER